MQQAEPEATDPGLSPVDTNALFGANTPTWRFQGDRRAADLAYCARFGVADAPEPSLARGGIWVYALPPNRPSR